MTKRFKELYINEDGEVGLTNDGLMMVGTIKDLENLLNILDEKNKQLNADYETLKEEWISLDKENERLKENKVGERVMSNPFKKWYNDRGCVTLSPARDELSPIHYSTDKVVRMLNQRDAEWNEIDDSGLLGLMIDYNLTWEAIYNIIQKAINEESNYDKLRVFIQNKIDECNEMYNYAVKVGAPTGPLLSEMEVLEQIELKIKELDDE